MLEQRGAAPEFPHVRLPYLIGYLFEVGPVLAAGMGTAPISHVEIAAWQANVGLALDPWEASFLRRLSVAYAVQQGASEAHDCPAPYVRDKAERRRYVARLIDEVFG